VRTLVLCENRTFLCYLIAFAKTQKLDLDFYLGEEFKVTSQTRLYAQGLNIEFLNELPKDKSKYEILIIHAYNDTFSKFFDNSFHEFKQVYLYSDGMRNGLSSLRNLTANTTKLIFFGFKFLEISALIRIYPKSFYLFSNSDCVPFGVIGETWKELIEAHSLGRSFDKIDIDSLLLVMRYWGNEDHYPIKSSAAYLDYLKDVVSKQESRKIIFKSHVREHHDFRVRDSIETLKLGQPDLSFSDWDDLVEKSTDFPELSSPEGYLWFSRNFDLNLCAFDSSLNTVAEVTRGRRRLNIPSKDVLNLIFDNEWLVEEILNRYVNSSTLGEFFRRQSPGTILEQVVVLRDFVLDEEPSYALTQERDALTQERDALTQERDALSQERDALSQERDALSQERDALSQERDALTNSSIWRLTRPLRKILNILKN
jgi:hypothetical protein